MMSGSVTRAARAGHDRLRKFPRGRADRFGRPGRAQVSIDRPLLALIERQTEVDEPAALRDSFGVLSHDRRVEGPLQNDTCTTMRFTSAARIASLIPACRPAKRLG